MRRPLSLALIFLCVGILPAQKRAITERDLFDFHWIGDFQISPTSSEVVYVETTVAPTHDGYETALYLLDTAEPLASPRRLMSTGTHDSTPRWSPDGKQIAFLRALPRDGKLSPAQLYLVPAHPGASPIRMTEMPKAVSLPTWLPGGQGLVVASETPQDPARAKHEATERDRATGDAAHVSDVRIIDRSSYRYNGEGYVDPSLVRQLYLISLPTADGTQEAPLQLTGGRFPVSEYILSPAHGWLFYSSLHEDEPVYDTVAHNSLYGFALPAVGERSKALPATGFSSNLALRASDLSLSPDGTRFAFHAEEIPPAAKEGVSHQQSDLWTLDLTWADGKPALRGVPRNLTGKLAYEMGSGVGGDNTAPRGAGHLELQWQDGSHVLDIAGSKGSVLLVSVDTSTGAVTERSAPHQAVLGFAARHGSTDVIALLSNPVLIGDLFDVISAASQKQLTDVNGPLFRTLNLTMPQDFQVVPTHHASDISGATIDTFVQLPPELSGTTRPPTPYPTILNIHGGPHAAYGWIFDHEMQFMAGKGYVVIYPNPRGSTTYGNTFANVIMNNYPGDDFHDLMDTVDDVVRRGFADPARLGVTGGSGGGLLTDWTVTQTDRFKAAVAQRDIVDWANWWYTADVAGFHQSFYPASPPFEHVDLYRAHSPLTFVNNVKTPMMFILGDADYRTPPSAGGEIFFRALKYKCIPTVMVRFPRESHELSRSGEPWHRIERLENIVNWFDLYLLGKPEPQYNTTHVPACHT